MGLENALYLYEVESIIVTAYEFIFSEKKTYRIARHLVFWLAYCIYFYLQSIPPRKFDEFFLRRTYFTALMNLYAFAPVFIGVTYFFIYYLLPNTIAKKKYLLFIAGFLLTYLIGTGINYFTAEWFLIVTEFFPNTFHHRIEMSNLNTRWGMIIATIALGLKLSKNWHMQQKENLEIVKNKLKMEMQSEKARIHPELLLRSLDNIYDNIQSGFDKAPSLILNLSEVLSYSLYENENVMVLLKNELMQLQHLIALEQEKKEGCLYIEMQEKGDMMNKYVAPMVLVKMLEQVITHLYSAGIFSCFVKLNLVAENNMLYSTFSFRHEDENGLLNINWESFITNTRNRLTAYYAPSDFTIKLVKNRNEIIMKLQLKLSEHTEDKKLIPNNEETAYDNL